MPSKIVSTLLEILHVAAPRSVAEDKTLLFQPFLRFWILFPEGFEVKPDRFNPS
jgi:hypothetical protein